MKTEEEKYQEFSRYASEHSFHDAGPLESGRRKRIRQVSIALSLLLLLLLWNFRVEIRDQMVFMFHETSEDSILETESETPFTETETEKQTETEPPFEPHAVETTLPETLIAETAIEVNEERLENPDFYVPSREIFFGKEPYTDVDGIVTFRGSNYRNSPAYGNARIQEGQIEGLWSIQTGALSYKNATWTGSGWTGQPLLRKWTSEEKAKMTMAEWAKQKEDLVEVIYACMDGYIYFQDLDTGEKTRDPLYLGYTFKGSGALDPRGYPILYVGAGYDSSQGTARAFIISLVDQSILYTFGNNDPFSLRGSLSYFDASPLVDRETDTLIWPGENGIIYLIHLNSSWDPGTGNLTLDPDDVVKWRYNGVRSSLSSYWLGMEDSPVIYQGYLYITDNGGNLMCLDLNTLKLVWVFDTLDDSNSTPVLSLEDGHPYLYVSTSFHKGWRSSTTAMIPIWKIDAETGEKIWQKDYECYTQEGVSGGVQSSMALGRESLEGRLYVTVAMTDASSNGLLACLDIKTGALLWQHDAYYTWSSPVCVYNEDGTGYVIYANCAGNLFLLNGQTGQVLSTFALSNGAIEASPAVYEDRVVIGTRNSKIWGLRLK